MRITPSILLAAMVACGSPAKSAEPTEPASDARDPDRERIAAMMVTFEKLIVAFEPADGDCDALADRIRTFAKTEDAEAIRAMSRDKELEGIIAANKELIERDYAALKDRFMGVMRPCERDDAVEHALDVSRLFHKRRVDENGATVEPEPESESSGD